MRSRKEIEHSNDKSRPYGSGHYDNNELLLEVLLDIRDLLTPTRAMTKGEEQDYVDSLSEKPEQSV